MSTDPALRLWVVLARAYNALAAATNRHIESHDLTPAEFAVLEALYHKGPLLLGEIQKKVLVSSGGMTWIVDRLVKRGLVERTPCPGDRRARYAGLTSEGRDFIAAIFPEHAEVVRRACRGLTAAEQREARELLKRLGLEAATDG